MASRVLNGDDNGGVSEAVFFQHLRNVDDVAKQKMALVAREKAVWKAATDDGISKDDLKVVMKDRAQTVDQRIASFNRRNSYRRFLKMPEALNLPVLEDMKDEIGLTEEARHKKWEDEGYVAGKSGKNRDVCPHTDPNSIGARIWMGGYDKGQAAIAPKKKPPEQQALLPAAVPNGEDAAAAPKKRGRPAGVSYWHHAEQKAVFAVTIADKPAPEGSVNVTKPEYEKLKAEYEAALQAEWDANDAAAKAAAAETDDFDDKADPPAPSAA